MVDTLVMLLSTDWFEPYWSSIGLDVEMVTRAEMQHGCREIVRQMLSGAKSYFRVAFSDERKKQTREMLASLARQAKLDTLLKVIEEWRSLTSEQLAAGLIYDSLTNDLLSGDIREGIDPKLGPGIATIMKGARRRYDLAPWEFLEKCESSETPWDRYTRELTEDMPTALADRLAAVLTAQRFEVFWNAVRDRLTSTQREALIAWYRAMAKARSRRDLVPAYVR